MSHPPGPEVPALRTPAGPEELRSALLEGHLLEQGALLEPELLRWVWCIACVETAGGDAIWNHNFGNLKAFSSWPGPWYRLPLPAGHPEPPYQRAYASRVDGATALWSLLLGARYERATHLARRGRFGRAVAELGRAGYYTAPIDGYTAAMETGASHYDRRWPPRHRALSCIVAVVSAAVLTWLTLEGRLL